MRNLSKLHGTNKRGAAMTVIAFPGTSFPQSSFPRATRSTSTPAPRLRLTARGRLVFGALAAIPIAILLTVAGINASDAAATHTATSNDFTYVSVAPGQSLWQIATEIAPQSDPDEVVADILSLNQLASADVQPGQELAIPTEYSR